MYRRLSRRLARKRAFAAALRRRQLALIIAGKMEPEQATELKALFYPEESQQ